MGGPAEKNKNKLAGVAVGHAKFDDLERPNVSDASVTRRSLKEVANDLYVEGDLPGTVKKVLEEGDRRRGPLPYVYNRDDVAEMLKNMTEMYHEAAKMRKK